MKSFCIKAAEEIGTKKDIIQWIEFIWEHPSNPSIIEELQKLKANEKIDKYVVLFIANSVRQTIEQLPDNVDDNIKLLIISNRNYELTLNHYNNIYRPLIKIEKHFMSEIKKETLILIYSQHYDDNIKCII